MRSNTANFFVASVVALAFAAPAGAASSAFAPPRNAESLDTGLAKQYAARALNSLSHPLDDRLAATSIKCSALKHSDLCHGHLDGPDPFRATVAMYLVDRAVILSIRLAPLKDTRQVPAASTNERP